MPDASKVHIYDDASLLTTVTVDGSGNWSKTGQSLTQGVHKIKGKAEDVAGNISGFSGIKNIYTGSVTTPTCDLLDDSGESSTDNVTNDNTPRIRAIVNLVDEMDALYSSAGIAALAANTVKAVKLQQSVDGGVTWTDVGTGTPTQVAESVFRYDFQIATALPDGEVQFRAMWQDQMDNWSAAGSVLSITVDTTAPNAPAITNVEDGQVFIGTSIDISGTAS